MNEHTGLLQTQDYGTWYYRLTIPTDLREQMGITQFKRSLHTDDETVAVKRQKILKPRLDTIIDRIRTQKLYGDDAVSLLNDTAEGILEPFIDERYSLGPVGFDSEALMSTIESFYAQQGHVVINVSRFQRQMKRLGIFDYYTLAEIVDKALVRFLGKLMLERQSEEIKQKIYKSCVLGGNPYTAAFLWGLPEGYDYKKDKKKSPIVETDSQQKNNNTYIAKEAKKAAEFHNKVMKQFDVTQQYMGRVTSAYFPNDGRLFHKKWKNMDQVKQAIENYEDRKEAVEVEARKLKVKNGTTIWEARRIARETIPYKPITA